MHIVVWMLVFAVVALLFAAAGSWQHMNRGP